MKPRLRDRLTVEKDCEEIEVFNWVNVNRWSTVRASNPVVSHEETEIGAGDASFTPDAITKWVAEELHDEFYITPEDHGIEVIDVESDEVTVL
ncbi:hypothetical protein ACFQO4_20815 [Saliphagus sp. GCM10025334]